MNNYKLFFRSILIIVILTLIISPGCTFWAKANYREFGRQGFDELKKIKDISENYNLNINDMNKNNVGQYIAIYSLAKEYIKNAKDSFDKMESYATTKDEKELAASLVNFADNFGKYVGAYIEIFELLNRSENWNGYQDPYIISEGKKITSEMGIYLSISNLELNKAQTILDRMPEYQEDFAYLYDLGNSKQVKDTNLKATNVNTISDDSYVDLFFAFIIFIFIIMPSGIAYYLVRKKSNRPEKVLNSILVGLGLFSIFIGILLPFSGYMIIFSLISGIIILLFGILLIILYILYYKDIPIKLKKGNKSYTDANDSNLEVNPDKQDMPLEYLKSFDKLTEKEIVAFLYLKNNQDIPKDKLNEMFGEETISSLIAKGHFREKNVNQN